MKTYTINKTTKLEVDRFGNARIIQLDPIIEPPVAVGIVHLRGNDLDTLVELAGEIEREERIGRLRRHSA